MDELWPLEIEHRPASLATGMIYAMLHFARVIFPRAKRLSSILRTFAIPDLFSSVDLCVSIFREGSIILTRFHSE